MSASCSTAAARARSTSRPGSANGWVHLAGQLQAPANASSVTVRQEIRSLKATICVDDIMLQPIDLSPASPASTEVMTPDTTPEPEDLDAPPADEDDLFLDEPVTDDTGPDGATP
jgi:hypothetical protein